MAPRLRVLAGTSPSTLKPITPLVNTPHAHPISSPLFEGAVVAYVKELTDEKGAVRDSEYFEREDRKGVTWSIQVQGRFLVPYSADDILFGNTFDRPLKLPWGTSAVLKFMHYIDPTLEHDLTSSTKPWALSPLISTMPHFMHSRVHHRRTSIGNKDAKEKKSGKETVEMPVFPPPTSIGDDLSELYLALAPLPPLPLPQAVMSASAQDAPASRDDSNPTVDIVSPISSSGSSSSSSSLSLSLASSTRNSSFSSSSAPAHLVVASPILIPGAIPPIPIPVGGKHTSSQSLSVPGSGVGAGARTGAGVGAGAGSPLSGSGTSSRSSLSVSSKSSVSSASSSSPSSSPSPSSSSVFSTSSNNSKSTRSSGGLGGSIRMKTKDVVRKVKVKGRKSGGGGAGVGSGGVEDVEGRERKREEEERKKKEEELKGLRSAGAAQRRAFFASQGKRTDVVFGPEDIITTDFCYGFINFAPSLSLQLPGGLSFDLMKYWDGQPVRFVCCERRGAGAGAEKGGDPWGRIFWCVAIEIVDDDDEEEEEEEKEGEEEEEGGYPVDNVFGKN